MEGNIMPYSYCRL